MDCCGLHSCKLSERTLIIDKKRNQGIFFYFFQVTFLERLSLRRAVIIGVHSACCVKQKIKKKPQKTIPTLVSITIFAFHLTVDFSDTGVFILFRHEHLHRVRGRVTGGLGVPHVQSHRQFPSLALLLLLHNSHFLPGVACQG